MRQKRNETLNFVERDSLRRIFVVQVKRAISERNDKTDKRQRQTIVYLNIIMMWPCRIHKYIDRKKPVVQPPSTIFFLSLSLFLSLSCLNWQLRISNDRYKQRKYDAKSYIYSSNTSKRRYKYDGQRVWQVRWYESLIVDTFIMFRWNSIEYSFTCLFEFSEASTLRTEIFEAERLCIRYLM